MNFRTLINFDIIINEKPFTFSVIPGTGLDEVELAMSQFQEDFKKMKEDALEKERKAKEESEKDSQNPEVVS